MMDFLGHVTRHTPFFAIYFGPNIQRFKESIFKIFFFLLFLTISTKFIELIGVFENYLFSVNCNRFVFDRDCGIKHFKILRSI